MLRQFKRPLAMVIFYSWLSVAIAIVNKKYLDLYDDLHQEPSVVIHIAVFLGFCPTPPNSFIQKSFLKIHVSGSRNSVSLSLQKISKSIHNFLSNVADRQTDK